MSKTAWIVTISISVVLVGLAIWYFMDKRKKAAAAAANANYLKGASVGVQTAAAAPGSQIGSIPIGANNTVPVAPSSAIQVLPNIAPPVIGASPATPPINPPAIVPAIQTYTSPTQYAVTNVQMERAAISGIAPVNGRNTAAAMTAAPSSGRSGVSIGGAFGGLMGRP